MANGNAPTGTAPLFLGNLVSQQSAMSERLTREMIRQSHQEKSQSARDRTAMLRALSFDTVRGLGRKVQEEHLNEMDSLRDKWSKKWIENGRKLTDRDYMELERDKANAEQKIGNLRNNVAQYAKYADEIKRHPDLFHVDTLDSMRKYAEEGDIGKEVYPLVKYMPDIEGYLESYIADIESNVPIRTEEQIQGDRAIRTSGRTKQEIMNFLEPKLQQDPKFQSLMQSDPYIQQKTLEALNSRLSKLTQTRTWDEPATETQIRRSKVEQLPQEHQKMVRDYNIDVTDKESLDWVKNQNDLTTKFLKGDKNVLENIKGATKSNWGVVSDAYMDRNGVITLESSDRNKPNITFKVDNWENESEVVGEKLKALEFLKGRVKGKDFRGSSSYLFADWDAKVEKKAEPVEKTYVRDWLNVPQSDVDNNETVEIGGEEYNFMQKSYREQFAKDLKSMFPEDSFTVTGRIGRGRNNFTWKPEGGTAKEYNLYKKEDRDRLLRELEQKVGGSEPAATQESQSGTVRFEVNGEPFAIPEEEVEEFMADFPNAKKVQ